MTTPLSKLAHPAFAVTLLSLIFGASGCGEPVRVPPADATNNLDADGDLAAKPDGADVEQDTADAVAETSVDTAAPDAPDPVDATDAVDAADVASPLPIPGFVCAAGVMETGTATPSGDCVETVSAPDGLSAATVEATCTDPNITALVNKRHLVVLPESSPRGTLWVHFGGSGGKPSSNQNIGNAAAAEGYHFISLAYPNEPSISARCNCPDGPRDTGCEERVRMEILYGLEMTTDFDMENDEAIVPRLKALLAYLETALPNKGWDQFTSGGDLVWSKMAVSGFSQGGGMAGLIARDHAVDRALYFSKGAGGANLAMVDGTAVQSCTAHAECASGACCPFNDPACETPAAGSYCQQIVPAPYAFVGKDIDGDGLGDGPVASRATAPQRQFAIIHRDEGAWEYSPEIFQAWGMGGREDYVDADTVAAPFPAGTQLFNTGLPPNLVSCSEHQSMGADACQPKEPGGKPSMEPAWRHAMSAVFP